MQFLEGGRYIAVVVDGKMHHYSKGMAKIVNLAVK